jgi:peptidoglycan L-alanyl-D-glutamate endopeptidase CwlK
MNEAGNAKWNATREEWLAIASIGKAYGFTWGGDWKGLVDNPHFEVI